MAKVSLYLNPNGASKEDQIILRVSHKSEQTTFYTGHRIEPKYWKKDRCTIVEIDRIIQKQKNRLETIVRDLQFENPDFTLKDVRQRFKEPKKEGDSLAGKIKDYMKSHSKEYSINTIKNYRTLYNYILILERDWKTKLTILDTDSRFYDAFKKYLWGVGNTNNTVEKLLIRLKSVINWCEKRGEKVSQGEFHIDLSEKEVIYLDFDELELMRNVVLPSHLDKARDMFLFSCYTGMRHSDIMNWNNNLRGSFIYVTQVKTKDAAIIPLNRYSQAILQKYGGEPPKVVNQQVNRELKQIAIKAGLNRKVSQVRYRGRERLEKVLPKHELLTFHCGRATFIMMYMANGVSSEIIMKATGHRDWKSFKKYVKIDEGMLLNVSEKVWG